MYVPIIEYNYVSRSLTTTVACIITFYHDNKLLSLTISSNKQAPIVL